MDYARASQSQPKPPKITQSWQEPPKNHPAEPARANQTQERANENLI